MRSRMRHNGGTGSKEDAQVVYRTYKMQIPGYLYYLDKQGDVSRSPLKRGAKAKKGGKKSVKHSEPVVEMLTPTEAPATKATDSPEVGGSMELIETGTKGSPRYSSKIAGTKLYHCEDGPARVEGVKQKYYQNGVLHREDGPAVDGKHYKEWWWKGMQHRVDGPAEVSETKGYYDGRWHKREGYYLFGQPYSKAEHTKIVNNKPLLEQMAKFMGASTHSAATVEKRSDAGALAPLFAVAAGLAGAGFMLGHSRGAKVMAKAGAKVVKTAQVQVGV